MYCLQCSFVTFFLVASAVATPMVRDALQFINVFGVCNSLGKFKSPFTKIAMSQTVILHRQCWREHQTVYVSNTIACSLAYCQCRPQYVVILNF